MVYLNFKYIQITVRLKNMVVPSYQSATIGECVTFYCTSDRSVYWMLESDLLRDGEFVQRGKIDNTDRHFLKIYIAYFKQEGRYTCASKENLLIYYDEARLEIFGKNCRRIWHILAIHFFFLATIKIQILRDFLIVY